LESAGIKPDRAFQGELAPLFSPFWGFLMFSIKAGELDPIYSHNGFFCKTRFLCKIMAENPSENSPTWFIKEAQRRLGRLPGVYRNQVKFTVVDVSNARTWLRSQNQLSPVKRGGRRHEHLFYGLRVSMNRLVAVAIGRAGGPTANPDAVLKKALEIWKKLPGKQRPRRPEHRDVIHTAGEFKNGRLLSLLPFAGMVSSLHDRVTPEELKAAKRFVTSCSGSIARAQAVLLAYAVSSH
jgi:hypothetical protein